MTSICPSIFRAFSRLGGAACFLAAAAVFLASSSGLIHAQGYTQTNLVSDGFVPAAVTDPNLKNPWGLVQSSGSPFWASDQGADVSTLYKGNGAIVPLVVAIPTAATPPNGPTGIVFNGGSGFVVTSTSRTSPSLFLFADLNGSIYGWNGGAGNTLADVGATVTGGALTGLAINASQTNLYAANFTPTGGILEFDSAFKPVATTFTDASLPAGYEPYNVADINGTIFAAYEPMQAGRPLQGAGNGIIAEFNDGTGTFIKNLVGGGQLDDPWGMALAPADFGAFSNDLLVGNFGNGMINAFDPTTGAFLGTIDSPSGNALTNDGLWALEFGTGGAGSSKSTLYITAGLNGQKDGVLAAITPTPEPASLTLLGTGLLALVGYWRRRGAGAAKCV